MIFNVPLIPGKKATTGSGLYGDFLAELYWLYSFPYHLNALQVPPFEPAFLAFLR